MALLRKNNKQTSSETDLITVVKTRYAKGEINKAGYDQLLIDLAPSDTQVPKLSKKDKVITES